MAKHLLAFLTLGLSFLLDSTLLLAQQKLAFVSGVSTYERDRFPRLEFAEDDAQEMKTVLTKLGFKVTDVIGAKASAPNIQNKFNTFLNKTKALKKEDIVVIYFSGHGLQMKSSGKGPDGKRFEHEHSYFCPTNALKSDVRTLLSLNQVLLRLATDSGSSNNLVLLDVCRENPDSGMGVDGSTFAKMPSTVSIFTAAQRGHRSFEHPSLRHGIFTHFLLDGLRGKAAAPGVSEITFQILAKYVTDSVERESAVLLNVPLADAQRPNFMSDSSRSAVLVARVDKDQPQPNEKAPASQNMEVNKSTFDGSHTGQVRNDNGLGMKMVWLSAGQFTMGSPRTENDRGYGEDQVEVTLTRGFWLGQTEVTQQQWTSVTGTEPWKGKENVREGANYAASYISWNDAVVFTKILTEQEQLAGRLPQDWQYELPTEAQWEYACRAGTSTSYSFGDDRSQLSDYAWYRDKEGEYKEGHAREVGKKKPNDFGLYDMHGNLTEWCIDIRIGKLPGGLDPRVETGGNVADKTQRGGCWGSANWSCRTAYRYMNAPDFRDSQVGFRVALVRMHAAASR